MNEKHFCHDCNKELAKGDSCFSYKADNNEFLKCEACHATDPALRNFRATEVYSRVVGYIRPVGQWNKGKRTEFTDRVEFKIEQPGCASC